MAQDGATFGERLKALRERTGKSQGEIAYEINERYGDRIRLTQTKLSTLEQRETTPRQEILEIFADHFHIPIAYFFDPVTKEQLESAKEYVQTRMNSNSEPARSYLEGLLRAPITNGPLQARSTGHRSDGDEVEQSLANLNWQPEFDENEYLDS